MTKREDLMVHAELHAAHALMIEEQCEFLMGEALSEARRDAEDVSSTAFELWEQGVKTTDDAESETLHPWWSPDSEDASDELERW
jgi:hypothetical protein